MNAKEQYKLNYSHVRSSKSRRWAIDNGYGSSMDNQSMKSYRMATAKNPMTFRQFIDCLEAADAGLAYATRKYWFFIVNGDELQFTKEECARFSRYFSEGFHLNFAGYTKIIKAGGLYINERLFEDDEVFPLKAKHSAYMRWIIGDKNYSFPCKWVCNHRAARYFTITAPFQVDYDTEQSDIQAEISMQRYGV